jgi:hypothetical protein
MPGREHTPNYRYGFNGQEMDNEISGISGGHTTAEFWEYDTRLGRRWNRDPVVKPWEAPFATFGNNPIVYSDPYGLDVIAKGRRAKRELKYARKNDPEFAKKYDRWVAEYEGKNNNLIITHRNSNKNEKYSDLATVQPQETNAAGRDPHNVQTEKRSDDTDYVFYDGLNNSTGVAKVTYSQQIFVEAESIPGKLVSKKWVLQSDISIPIREWTTPDYDIHIIQQEYGKLFMLDFSIDNPRSDHPVLNFYSKVPATITIADGSDHSVYPFAITCRISAMSIPVFHKANLVMGHGWVPDLTTKLDSQTTYNIARNYELKKKTIR